MGQNPKRVGQKACRMNATAINADARWMLEQLAMPVDPRDTIKARRERAIRRSGLTPAKGFRLWYAQKTALLAHEFVGLVEAYKVHVRTQERLLHDELEQLRALRLARELREKQIELDLSTYQSRVAPNENTSANVD